MVKMCMLLCVGMCMAWHVCRCQRKLWVSFEAGSCIFWFTAAFPRVTGP